MGSYRDDHDAALARAAALQDELDRTRAAGMDREREVARLQAQLAAEREKAATLAQKLGTAQPVEVRQAPADDPRYRAVVAAALLFVGVVMLLVFSQMK